MSARWKVKYMVDPGDGIVSSLTFKDNSPEKFSIIDMLNKVVSEPILPEGRAPEDGAEINVGNYFVIGIECLGVCND